MIIAGYILAAVAGGVAGYLFGWRRGYWRGYDTAWFRREGKQPRRPKSMGNVPGTSGGER